MNARVWAESLLDCAGVEGWRGRVNKTILQEATEGTEIFFTEGSEANGEQVHRRKRREAWDAWD